MKDKSLEIWITALFGFTGLAVILLTWFGPALESNRIAGTLIGLTGLVIALLKYIGLRKILREENEKVTVEVEARNRH
jgi:drug/metabolite transporter (DMT)-like permease